jgi:hypothetical protein
MNSGLEHVFLSHLTPYALNYGLFQNSALTGKFELTEKARLVKQKGGIVEYNIFIKKQDQKLEYDLKNAKRVYQTYWFTFGIAVLAFLISLVLVILKIREPATPAH